MWLMTVQDVTKSTPHATFATRFSPEVWILERLDREPEIKYAVLWSRQVPNQHTVVLKLQEMRQKP